MAKEKMNVHRALAELKTLDSRIQKAARSATYCFANKHSNGKKDGITIDDYKNRMKSEFDSINTLINRRNALKRAVAFSNSVTKVTIDGVEYTVAEAIEMKNHGMDNYRVLLTAITANLAAAKNIIQDQNGEYLEKKANDYIIGFFGGKDKADSETATSMRKAYIEENTYDFIDPMNIEDFKKKLEDKIASFEAEVDAALSVSNAITNIEFEYEIYNGK